MTLRPRVALIALVVLASLALTSCSSVTDRVQSALDSASSAGASAETVLRLYGDGRALPALTDTVLGDALTELDGATTDLTEAGPIGDDADASDRDDGLAAIRAATDAVLAARETVASGGDPAADIRALDQVTNRLHDLSGSIGS